MTRRISKNVAIGGPSYRENQRLLARLADMATDEMGWSEKRESKSTRTKPIHVLNRVLAWVGSQPLPTQRKILLDGRAIEERHLASDTPFDYGLNLLADDPLVPTPAEGDSPRGKSRRA